MLKQTPPAEVQSSPVVKPGFSRQRLVVFLQYAIFPIAILLLWQICSEIGFVRRNVLPPPSTVLSVWYDLVTGRTDEAARYSGTWLDHAWASTWRVFAGFGWGVSLGIFVGLLIGLSRALERVFDPTI